MVPKIIGAVFGTLQRESLPGNSKKPHCADHESCCLWGSASGTLYIGWLSGWLEGLCFIAKKHSLLRISVFQFTLSYPGFYVICGE